MPSRRSPFDLRRARARRGWLRALRDKHPAQPRLEHVTPADTSALAAAIRAHDGRYEDIIIRAAHAHGVSLSLACAVIEMESGFRNVFGHDAVANPVRSPPGRTLEVTEERYREYLRHRNAGMGSQGVGPMQLTYHTLQDRADQLGGCWRPEANIEVGIELLASQISAHGTRDGVRRYNGPAGSSAERYADTVLARERAWRGWLAHATADGGADAAANGHGDVNGGAPRSDTHHAGAAPPTSGPRVFRLTRQTMSGTDVKAFQDLLNRRLEAWGIDLRIAEDGVYGASTRDIAQRVARGLGIAAEDYSGAITPALRTLMRTPSRRTPEQLARARAQRPWLATMRRQYAVANSTRYPLGRRGRLIGTPYSGTHTLGNWQSDNAVDIGVPVGTPMLAMDDGVIEKVRHHPQGQGRFAGDQITLRGDRGNSWFYGHGIAGVTVGQRVRRGQPIGTSGSANGVAHLHFGVRTGDPRQLIGQQR
jgi:murein DD-endopeptidase MepM/ murein hydrolase activator NlpD